MLPVQDSILADCQAKMDAVRFIVPSSPVNHLHLVFCLFILRPWIGGDQAFPIAVRFWG